MRAVEITPAGETLRRDTDALLQRTRLELAQRDALQQLLQILFAETLRAPPQAIPVYLVEQLEKSIHERALALQAEAIQMHAGHAFRQVGWTATIHACQQFQPISTGTT